MRSGQAPLRIGLTATGGRMGRALAGEIDAAPDLALDQDRADVLIDFSAPAALAASLDRARTAAIPIVIGTTGLDALADARMAEAAGDIALLHAANTSLGVTLLAHLVGEAASRLGPEWDVQIFEMHHAAKADAPSGTALLLGEQAGNPERVGYAALRGGTVVGDHDVIFAGPSERLILSHRAESRDVFARGALAAARWIAGKPPGRYTMNDVLGL